MMRVLAVTGFAVLALAPVRVAASEKAVKPTPLASVAQLMKDARARVDAPARVPLADVPDVGDTRLRLGAADQPNYLRALSAMPHAGKPFALLVEAVLHRGALPLELKAAMGLRVAQINRSPYVAAHTIRLLRSSDKGKALLAAVAGDTLNGLDPAGQHAVRYTDLLTRSVHGVTPETFARTRAVFTDAEIVELTITTSFFNFFTRFAEGTRLPVESWALDDSVPIPTADAARPPRGRVALLSDDTIMAAAAALETARQQNGQRGAWGIGMANSMRAMLQAPSLALPWRAFMTTVREKETVARDIKLQVSFAVSMVNECRYCTIHQVLGLRRLGIEPAKLIAMKKDDAALTSREAIAVRFARKLTSQPGSSTDADYEPVRREFGDLGALEVLVQTCTFAFMNRFTDGLMLPSEDEAVRVYQETYGTAASYE